MGISTTGERDAARKDKEANFASPFRNAKCTGHDHLT
jgi:hypothetical protein